MPPSRLCGSNFALRIGSNSGGTAGIFTASQLSGTSFLAGVVMLANWLMLVLFYLVLVVPVLWRLQPPKLVTPF
jgi:hypothetical protein